MIELNNFTKRYGGGWHALAQHGHVVGVHGDASDAMPPQSEFSDKA
jgi:hypothetical protein